jgi:hypothetical protein
MASIEGTNPLIQGSTSLTSLALFEALMSGLDDASKTVIKERIVEFRLSASPYCDPGGSTLGSIIAGSKAMKRVILDGAYLRAKYQVGAGFLETLKIVQEACKKKEIELWKENFDVGNGKVDLEK